MTKTAACRRVALAALVTATVAGAHEARADFGFKITVNGIATNGVNVQGPVQGLSPHGADRPDAAALAARAADPNRLRLRAVRPAGPEGVRVAAGTTDKPEPTPTPKK